MNNLFVGQPIRSLQSFLRRIAVSDSDIPKIIPDGIYGEQTRACVSVFQTKYNLEQTGEADIDTWNTVVRVYDEIIFAESEPVKIKIYPASDYVVEPGDSGAHIFPIQGMLSVVSRQFPEIGIEGVSGVHDEISVGAVKKLQKIFGILETGTIDKRFWECFAKFYESHAFR